MILVSTKIRSKNKTNTDKLSEKAPTAKKMHVEVKFACK